MGEITKVTVKGEEGKDAYDVTVVGGRYTKAVKTEGEIATPGKLIVDYRDNIG